jgi:hypothetical protein
VTDKDGNKVKLFNEDATGGLEIRRVRRRKITSPKAEKIPLYAKGIECRASERHMGGVVVQPVEVWAVAKEEKPIS